MSNVEKWLWKLVEEYAPNGVGKISIKSNFKRIRGTAITAKQMAGINNPDGDIKIFAGGKTEATAFEKDIPKANITKVPAVLVKSRGVIDFLYYDKPFTFKNEMWAYTSDEKISIKYLNYYLQKNVEYFRNIAKQMGSMPQISTGITEDYSIYLPPIEIQEAIVKFLDKFETMTTSMESGIPAHIDKVHKQYEHYRDKLLTFEELNED